MRKYPIKSFRISGFSKIYDLLSDTILLHGEKGYDAVMLMYADRIREIMKNNIKQYKT